MRRLNPALLCAALLAALVPTAPALADPVVLVGATLHPVSAEPIENGVLVLDGDRIVAMGADIEIPAGATVVDVSGKHIYPSLVHSHSTLGLGLEPAHGSERQMGQRLAHPGRARHRGAEGAGRGLTGAAPYAALSPSSSASGK